MPPTATTVPVMVFNHPVVQHGVSAAVYWLTMVPVGLFAFTVGWWCCQLGRRIAAEPAPTT